MPFTNSITTRSAVKLEFMGNRIPHNYNKSVIKKDNLYEDSG